MHAVRISGLKLGRVEELPTREILLLAKIIGSSNTEAMSDNVVKFKRPQQPKPPRQTPPWLRKVVTLAAVVAAFAAAYAYFYFIG